MKRRNWIACTAVSLVLAAAAEEGHFDLKGDFGADGVAAVPLAIDVYRACGAGEGRLGRELRVQDAQGVAQPYVLRRRCAFKAHVETQSESCRIRDLSENADGSITLTAAVREGFDIGRARVSGVEIGTSLKDFAQMVVISAADGTKIAEGRIFDYTRFASVRSTTVAVGGKLPREFTITLRRPVTEVESAAFERVVSTGAVNSVSIRRMAQEQSFRVDAVRVCYQTTSMVKEPLPPDRVTLAGGETGDGCYVYEAYSAPIEMAEAAPGAENWAFDVLVECRGRASGQRTERRERLYAINLPNRISAKRNFSCWPDPEDGRIRFRIDRGDNPPVPLGNPPFVFLMEPYEVVFVAKRGESYRLAFDRGADAPRYSDGVLSYLHGETSARTLTAVQVGEFNAPTEVELPAWIQENWATAASLLVLVVLVLFGLRSFGKVSLIAFVLLSVTGCATSQMKSTPFYSGSERVYTGRVEDRVNLWPFAYYREPALSVLWPLFSLTDDHLAVRPIY